VDKLWILMYLNGWIVDPTLPHPKDTKNILQ